MRHNYMRPSGMARFTAEQHLEALQSRNSSNLLEILGTSEYPPLIAGEILEKDNKIKRLYSHYFLQKGLDLVKRATGASGLLNNMQSIASRPLQMMQNRMWANIENYFLPIQKLLRGITVQYEKFITEHKGSAAIGGALGGITLGAIGYMYLGPIGWTLGSTFGEMIGATTFAALEEWGIIVDPAEDDWIRGPTISLPDLSKEKKGKRGGAPTTPREPGYLSYYQYKTLPPISDLYLTSKLETVGRLY